jgi:exodeoxyribonuclease VII large subunit
MNYLSVSELNNQIKALNESHFYDVIVEGEISAVTYHSSGHIYFTIKDSNSIINCALWRSKAYNLKFRLEVGMKIVIFGSVSIYIPRGEYKLIANRVENSGVGNLKVAFEQLKNELQSLGYFDSNKKKPLPKFPKKIAIISAKNGAGLKDMLKIAENRWPLVEITVFDTLVQGEKAAKNIAYNINRADKMNFDVIVVGRGGGSIEDLWGFNERVVADEIYKAITPIISAVGHDVDYLISDFVADVRASTPSNAMEILLPDINDTFFMLDDLVSQFEYKLKNILHKKEREILNLSEVYKLNSIEYKLDSKLEEINIIKERFNEKIKYFVDSKNSILEKINFDLKNRMENIINKKEDTLLKRDEFKFSFERVVSNKERNIIMLNEAYERINPENRELDGFAELTKNGEKINIQDLKENDEFELSNTKNIIKAKVIL